MNLEQKHVEQHQDTTFVCKKKLWHHVAQRGRLEKHVDTTAPSGQGSRLETESWDNCNSILIASGKKDSKYNVYAYVLAYDFYQGSGPLGASGFWAAAVAKRPRTDQK